MQALTGCQILLVEDDDDTRMLMALCLRHSGAEVREAANGEEALALVTTWQPDVVISDLTLPGIDGNTMLAAMRGAPALHGLRGIALTGHGGQAHRDAAFAAGFAKHMLKPVTMSDLVVAIQAVAGPRSSAQPGDVREILLQLNHASPCRFTSLLRFADAGTLASVWTYDREHPEVDPFPLGLPVEASFCVLVRAAAATFVVENAATDPRTTEHPKREEIATYIGVPLFRPDGQIYGTVCSYDPRPLALEPIVVEMTERATRALETIIFTLVDSPPA